MCEIEKHHQEEHETGQKYHVTSLICNAGGGGDVIDVMYACYRSPKIRKRQQLVGAPLLEGCYSIANIAIKQSAIDLVDMSCDVMC